MKTTQAGKAGGLVYSTGHGKMCPACSRPVNGCVCSRAKSGPATDGPVRVRRETKGRNGKAVTVIAGLPLGSAELAELARQLKKKCGSGGTVQDGAIEIQGDHCDALVAELKKQGWAVKRSGG